MKSSRSRTSRSNLTLCHWKVSYQELQKETIKHTFCKSRNLIPVANTSTQDTPCYSCKWSGYLGMTRRCSMHVFTPVLSWDGQSISGLLWPGMVQLIYLWISMPFDGVTGHPSASIGPTLNGNHLDSPCVFINEGNELCYYGNGYQDFVEYITSYFCTQCKVILTNTIWQQLNLLRILT